MSPEPLLITGDFNIHVDVPADIDRSCLLELRPLVPCYDDYLRVPGESDGGLNADSATQGICLISLFLRTKITMLTYLINEACKQFYSNFISENSSSQRDLFNATRKLLKQENEVSFPPLKDGLQLQA